MASDASDLDRQLVDAVWRGDEPEIGSSIAAGANPNALVRNWTPLQRAAANGHVAAIVALLAAGARLNDADAHGISPLIHAVQWGHTAAMAALLAAGADVHRAATNGVTALHWASRHGHLEIARGLVAAGARTDVRNKDGKRPGDEVGACAALPVVAEHCRRSAATLQRAGVQLGQQQVARGRSARPARGRGPVVPPAPRRARLLLGRVGGGD
jgi:ankyrin repeat protein